jgi:hypothetical protein
MFEQVTLVWCGKVYDFHKTIYLASTALLQSGVKHPIVAMLSHMSCCLKMFLWMNCDNQFLLFKEYFQFLNRSYDIIRIEKTLIRTCSVHKITGT